MTDRRTCACGEFVITEYGVWGPCCMTELASLVPGDAILINDHDNKLVVKKAVLIDDTGNPLTGLELTGRVFDGRAQDYPGVWTYVIDVESGSFFVEEIDDDGQIFTMHICDPDDDDPEETALVLPAPQPIDAVNAPVLDLDDDTDEAA